MKGRLTLIAVIMAGAVLSLGIRVSQCAAQATLLKFSDESLGFPGEISTNVSVLATTAPPNPLGVTQIYSKTLFKPRGLQSFQIDWNCTGDVHGGVGQELRALIDGQDCNPAGGGAEGNPDGWTVVEKHFNYQSSYLLPDGIISLFPGGDGGGGAGDMHDNVCTYSWCCAVSPTPGVHTLTVRMGTSCGTGSTPTCDPTVDTTVFEEKVHVAIDGSATQCGTGSAGSAG
jgi:hypothetical protein